MHYSLRTPYVGSTPYACQLHGDILACAKQALSKTCAHCPATVQARIWLSSQGTSIMQFPTRFGMMCAQMKSFFDATGTLWQKGELAGKPATMLTSSASQVCPPQVGS